MSAYNEKVVAQAERCVSDAIAAVLGLKKGGAVIGVAPAGAGKSYAIGSAVLAAGKAGLRVAVATPTNEQAFALAADVADRVGRSKQPFQGDFRLDSASNRAVDT